MRKTIGVILMLSALTAIAQSEMNAISQQPAAEAPWIMKREPFDNLCGVLEPRAFLGFDTKESCLAAVSESASHCDQVLTEDFSKYIGTPEFESKRSFFSGAANGCFTAQLNAKTNGKFVALLQALAKGRKGN